MSYISAIRQGDNVVVWERHDSSVDGRIARIYPAPYHFYVEDPDGEFTGMHGQKLAIREFDTARRFYHAKKMNADEQTRMYESDIASELRVLSQRYYEAKAPDLNVTFFDIEVDYVPELGFSTIANPYAPVNSVALYHQHEGRFVVLAVPPQDANCEVPDYGPATQEFIDELNEREQIIEGVEIDIHFCKDERELLIRFLGEIENSDVISGWNSDYFDVPYIGTRLKKLGTRYFNMLSFPNSKEPSWREIYRYGQPAWMLDLNGRVSLDYLDLFRKYEVAERPSYKLESIADEIVPELPKLNYEGSLALLYRNDFTYFVRYNIRDTEILKGFEDRLGYVGVANDVVHLSTGLFKHVGGTLKLAELATINHCHHKLDPPIMVNDMDVPLEDSQIQGALVLNPQVGEHNHVGMIDIKSLYPNAIRMINISPETLRGQFVAETHAAKEIADKSDKILSFRYEDGTTEEHSAIEWREVFKEKGWAVSGFGTAFDQTVEGIIPKILGHWFDMRVDFQKKKAEAKAAGNEESAAYYDRLQYVYKIKLNSFYGALTNKYFRFYDLRLGESTTATGRAILRHQCAEVNRILKGEYDVAGEAVVYGDSVSGTSLIETPHGEIEIKDLFKEISYTKGTKEYSLCDDQALTYVERSHQNEFRNIKYVMRHKVNKQMFRVWFGNTRYLDVTEDHALIGYANSNHKNPGLIGVKPSDVGKNNINSLLLNSYIPHKEYVSNWQLSPEMFQLMGLIIGDGHVEKKKQSGVGLSIGAQDKHEIIKKVIEPLISQGWFTSVIHMKNGHDIRLCGVKGWTFLREQLYPRGIKEIPEWIFDNTSHDIRNFIKGYFSADGFANKNKTVGLCSTNLKFIKQVNRLLKIVHIPSNYWTETTENSFNGQYSGTYTTKLTVYCSQEFGEQIGFIQNRKNKNISTTYSTNTQHRLNQKSFCLITPSKIEKIEYVDYVYDIEIDDTHTFYANDILVHNTDSTYFQTYMKNDKDAVDMAVGIGDMVNNSFNDFLADTFLISDKFHNIISTECELVTGRGIYVSKKRYILRLIWLDGYFVDLIKVMGLDTKKTTLPNEVSKELNTFIERYLKGDDWDVIAEEIVEYKEVLSEPDNIMGIGLPKGIKGIEDYTNKLIKDPTHRLPGHVAAAMMYNLCLEKYSDNVSPKIVSGNKIKVFYFNQKFGRFKSIAIPVDIEIVPQWFFDEYADKIDTAAQIQRLVDNPIKNIITAIGKDVPTKQSLYVDSELIF